MLKGSMELRCDVMTLIGSTTRLVNSSQFSKHRHVNNFILEITICILHIHIHIQIYLLLFVYFIN